MHFLGAVIKMNSRYLLEYCKQ